MAGATGCSGCSARTSLYVATNTCWARSSRALTWLMGPGGGAASGAAIRCGDGCLCGALRRGSGLGTRRDRLSKSGLAPTGRAWNAIAAVGRGLTGLAIECAGRPSRAAAARRAAAAAAAPSARPTDALGASRRRDAGRTHAAVRVVRALAARGDALSARAHVGRRLARDGIWHAGRSVAAACALRARASRGHALRRGASRGENRSARSEQPWSRRSGRSRFYLARLMQQPCTQTFPAEHGPESPPHSCTPGSHSMPLPAQKTAHASPESPPLFWSPSWA